MIKLPTKKEEELSQLREQMNSIERYTESWLSLQEKYQKLFREIEKERRQ